MSRNLGNINVVSLRSFVTQSHLSIEHVVTQTNVTMSRNLENISLFCMSLSGLSQGVKGSLFKLTHPSSACLFHFVRLFWNHTLTCVSLSFKYDASCFLSEPTTQWFLSNDVSRQSSWKGVNAVLMRLARPGLPVVEAWGIVFALGVVVGVWFA